MEIKYYSQQKILLLQCVMDRPQTLGTDDLGLNSNSAIYHVRLNM